MSALILVLFAFVAFYGVVAWVRADGGSIFDVARQDLAQVNARIHGDGLIGPHTPDLPPGLFTVTGRHGYSEPAVTGEPHRTKTRRQRGGVEIGPMPDGGGRARNPNAPCWLCGQNKTPNHKCI